MKRIAIINHRYGKEINGGSEYYTRLIAEHLQKEFEIEVLTTKAIDYITWENHYTEDTEVINGIKVRRFPVSRTRDIRKFADQYGKLMQKPVLTDEEEQFLIREQGPYCPALTEYIADNRDNYDLFVFVTYLYYTTVEGLKPVYDKAVLISTAHDEPFIYLRQYRDVFRKVRGFVFLTEEERDFVQQLFHNSDIPNTVTSVGIDLPEINTEAEEKNYEIYHNSIVYAGRISRGKGCPDLFDYFLRYKEIYDDELKLVLMGKVDDVEVPEHKDIIYRGFVSEEEKFYGFQNAKALVLPSQFESLSIAVLEALQVGTPVLVNGRCDVLKGHCQRSQAGFYYYDEYDFAACLRYLSTHEAVRRKMGENGINYVNSAYRWDLVTAELSRFFHAVMGA